VATVAAMEYVNEAQVVTVVLHVSTKKNMDPIEK
jgi:hypothetical protein